VVCGDLRTGCSKEITLDVAPPLASEKPIGIRSTGQDELTLAVRICAPCSTTLFSKRDFLQSLHSPPPAYVRAYLTLVSFQTGIREQLPRFQRIVDGLQRKPDDRNAVVEAMRMKKRIVEALAKVDGVVKQIAAGAGTTGAEERLRKAVALATASWGQDVGLRVKGAASVLDNIVESARPTAAAEIAARLGRQAKALPPAPKSTASVKVTVNGADWEGEEDVETEEEIQRRETVVVLEEQKFLVLGMLEEAKNRRRFDEVEALGRSLEEIEEEVLRLGGGVVGV
jgi:rabenosyn-5